MHAGCYDLTVRAVGDIKNLERCEEVEISDDMFEDQRKNVRIARQKKKNPTVSFRILQIACFSLLKC